MIYIQFLDYNGFKMYHVYYIPVLSKIHIVFIWHLACFCYIANIEFFSMPKTFVVLFFQVNGSRYMTRTFSSVKFFGQDNDALIEDLYVYTGKSFKD